MMAGGLAAWRGLDCDGGAPAAAAGSDHVGDERGGVTRPFRSLLWSYGLAVFDKKKRAKPHVTPPVCTRKTSHNILILKTYLSFSCGHPAATPVDSPALRTANRAAPGPPSMTASILPFARPINAGPFRFTPAEVAQTAAWAAPLGPEWGVETFMCDDGTLALGIVTPSSEADPANGPALLAWIVERTAAGIALIDAETCAAVGVFPGLHGALVALLETETARQLNAA
jgi:hypothetical protein